MDAAHKAVRSPRFIPVNRCATTVRRRVAEQITSTLMGQKQCSCHPRSNDLAGGNRQHFKDCSWSAADVLYGEDKPDE